jgi:hypothetical protein
MGAVPDGTVEAGAVELGLDEEEEPPPPEQLQAKAIVARTMATPRRRNMASPPLLGALTEGSCDLKTAVHGT